MPLTAFPEKVNERRTSIASSFYRLMEGENHCLQLTTRCWKKQCLMQ